ncbi:MAG: hypothetical protein A2939_04335 [Parcubacteria group bacterium RIFCSPLOWO2_01_FULL_48_18]|nr:MAG: hypothetical protein A2939_04335 [Parcubacteria group bacterium RIFCSPLOWO2_01_FULL_48_18]
MAVAIRKKRITLAHLNPWGTLHGGILMKWMDEASGDAAQCHTERLCVTVHVDNLDFHRPIHAEELLILSASVNRVWNTSLEVGIRAETLNESTGQICHVASAYFVFVALDENGRPTPVTEVIPRTAEEKRRYKEAGLRHVRRLKAVNRKRRKTFSDRTGA